ncbi:hypothetical protein SAY86_027915 [Trapa natans]|uniref:Uncharacterized protein n=1 Tax=Trapa natans TaxID=22666 RepID=A0AAN7R879_TRANT|nr:hypothetical protein SAY86_027915 [Trapa natans]
MQLQQHGLANKYQYMNFFPGQLTIPLKRIIMRGRIPDKWSMRILWMSAIGSGIGLYMVVVERQLQNRERMAAEGVLFCLLIVCYVALSSFTLRILRDIWMGKKVLVMVLGLVMMGSGVGAGIGRRFGSDSYRGIGFGEGKVEGKGFTDFSRIGDADEGSTMSELLDIFLVTSGDPVDLALEKGYSMYWQVLPAGHLHS